MELGAPIRNFITKEESKKLVDTAKSENRIEEYENELIKYHNTIIGDMVYCIPTAKQMIGWLENVIPVSEDLAIKQIIVESYFDGRWNYFIGLKESEEYYPSRKEATLAAIDAALEYLTKIRSDYDR